MRVAVDGTPLLDPRTGVGVFTAEIVGGLAGTDGIEPVVYAASWRGRGRLAETAPAGVEVVDRPLPARPARALWARADRPRIEWWTGPIDLVHGTNFVVPPCETASVVTVHDLTFLHYPDMVERDVLAYPTLVRRAVARGAWVHTPSGFVADEVREAFATDRVRAVPNGVSTVPGAPPGAGRARAGWDRYVLALGTVEPRKDLPTLVRAFAAAAGDLPGVGLVIAGADGWGADAVTEAVDASGVGERVRRTGWVDDGERAALLRDATVLAYPSRYEGFGLPPLEAMSVGVPVVCSDAGALPETVGDAALTVPPGDVDALARQLVRLCTDAEEADRLAARGRARAGEFPWSATVAGLVDLYRDAGVDGSRT